MFVLQPSELPVYYWFPSQSTIIFPTYITGKPYIIAHHIELFTRPSKCLRRHWAILFIHWFCSLHWSNETKCNIFQTLLNFNKIISPPNFFRHLLRLHRPYFMYMISAFPYLFIYLIFTILRRSEECFTYSTKIIVGGNRAVPGGNLLTAIRRILPDLPTYGRKGPCS